MSETTDRSAYDKLSPQRKQLADMLVANLDSGRLWKQGWRTRGAPENAVTGKKYRGVNNLYLFLVAMERGYSDNRCLPSAIISIPPLAAPSSAGTFCWTRMQIRLSEQAETCICCPFARRTTSPGIIPSVTLISEQAWDFIW